MKTKILADFQIYISAPLKHQPPNLLRKITILKAIQKNSHEKKS